MVRGEHAANSDQQSVCENLNYPHTKLYIVKIYITCMILKRQQKCLTCILQSQSNRQRNKVYCTVLINRVYIEK